MSCRLILIKKIAKLVSILSLVAIITAVMMLNTKTNNLKVVFPTFLLRPAPVFVDPSDTNTVFEYYLLENLAIGLVRDDHTKPDGFTPLIAKSWVKKENSWRFILRNDLKWSDGSPITLEQIINHFKHLSKSESRHLKYIKSINSIESSEHENSLEFFFKGEAPDNFLDELSLADATLFRGDQPSENNWRITSGPYFIDKQIDGKLFLKKNSFFKIYSEFSESVELSIPENLDAINNGESYDLIPESAMPFNNTWKSMPSRFDKIFSGSYNDVTFFSFTSDKWSDENRKALVYTIQKVFAELSLPDGFKLDNQIVAVGSPERLEKVESISAPPLSIPFKLSIPKGFLDLKGFTDKIDEHFDGKVTLLTDSCSDCDLNLEIFSANQKEPTGNWSFLVTGALKRYSLELNPLLAKALEASNSTERIEALKKLNKKVIENNYLAPVMWSQTRYFHSDKISLEKWNPFDLRMRIYLIERP